MPQGRVAGILCDVLPLDLVAEGARLVIDICQDVLR